MRVLFLSQAEPSPSSGGGPRRTHQLWHELIECFGLDNVVLAPASEFVLPHKVPPGRLQKLLSTIGRNIVRRDKKKISLRFDNPRSVVVVESYRRLVQSASPDAVLVESADVHYLAEINNEFGLKTVSAPWSIEALTNKLDHLITAFRSPVCDVELVDRVIHAFHHLAEDLVSGSKCERIWTLSRLECGFLKAAGLRCDYLPYYPVGDAELYLERIRVQRRSRQGTFLICGGGITQNEVGLKNFLQQLKPTDMPSGAKIVIVGMRDLPVQWVSHLSCKVEFQGRLSDEDFCSLLSQSQAVLVPQNCGFGCATRVADSLRAGVPVIADSIVGNGMGDIPGLTLVEDARGKWPAALHAAMTNSMDDFFESSSSWHLQQRAAAHDTIQKLCP